LNLRDQISVLTTGGTFDKIYFDAKSEFEIGDSVVGALLTQGVVRHPFEITEVMRKDSLELQDEDREQIRKAVETCFSDLVVITHGTDTMTKTAQVLVDFPNKVIVLTGALSPARFSDTDALFNLGMAFGAVQTLPPGVYIAMNGSVFNANEVRKDRSQNTFVEA
jgi:L-asparaginase